MEMLTTELQRLTDSPLFKKYGVKLAAVGECQETLEIIRGETRINATPTRIQVKESIVVAAKDGLKGIECVTRFIFDGEQEDSFFDNMKPADAFNIEMKIFNAWNWIAGGDLPDLDKEKKEA